MLSRARSVDRVENPKAATVGEPTDEWNNEDDRPDKLLQERLFPVDQPEANDQGDADPEAERADANCEPRMLRAPCNGIEKRR